MRIGMFADMYLPHVSGVTNHISLYKRRFEELGHEVFVFTFGDRDYADAEPNVVRTPGIPWGETGWRFATALSREAREALATLDVAHVHHPFQSGRLVRPLCARHDIPLVFTNHTRYDLYSDAYAGFVPRGVRYTYLRTQLGGFCRSCDLVIAPAASIAEWLTGFADYPHAAVIPNGIDIARFASPATRVSRAELGFAEDDVVFCYAGRLGPEKNTEWLAEEFALAAASSPRARLLVIGDGPSRATAERIIAEAGVAERTRFLGMQPYDRLPALEAAADVFVTGSVSEVHPLVVIEAMAAGLPVVAVDSPGIGDTVADGATGLLATAAEPGALASRMTRLATDDAERTRMGSAAVAAADNYSWTHTADVVLAHYERLVRARAGSR
jgi:glycosyltransferase involved in cell wall biosynthesis